MRCTWFSTFKATCLLVAASLLLTDVPLSAANGAATQPGEGTPAPAVVSYPGFLPYGLGTAFAVDGPTHVAVTIPPDDLPPDPTSRGLATLFRYDTAAGRWQPLPTDRQWQGNDLLLTADITGPATLAAALSTSTETGNYEQPWQPTVQDFQVDLFTGAATVSIPVDVPAGRGGLAPGLALNYNSTVVDALHGDVNPQASWAGLGWSLDLGYIARTIELDANYVPTCTNEYTLVLNSVSSKLVSIGGGQYRTEDERYWRIQRISTTTNRGGEYWLATTPDGTQYRFGYQDETAGADSRESAWWMVTSGCDTGSALRTTNWRWNLDQISDTSGNVVRLDYRRETNDFVFPWAGEAHIYSSGRWCNGAAECLCQVYGQTYFCHDYMAGQANPSGYTRGGSLEQITTNRLSQIAYRRLVRNV